MNQSAVILKITRLLNEARIRLRESVDGCGRCEKGVIVRANPDGSGQKVGEKCDDCGDDRDFLERCTKLCGPVIQLRDGAFSGAVIGVAPAGVPEDVKRALRDVGPAERE